MASDNKPVILNVDDEEFIKFQIHRGITDFYKEMLIILEDLAEEHDTALCKLQDHLPNEYKKYVDLADYLTEDKFKNLRGKILSKGNNTIREIEKHLDNFDINLKKAKE